MIILYVRDQEKSKTFYEGILNKKPVLHVPGMTEFELGGDVLLGLMPEKSISKILEGKTPSPETGNGIPRCELYLIVEDVNIAYQRAISSGAKEVSAPSARDWGDHVGYCSDPDGHILAFAN
ncbi:MAG: putative lactoylglutathione lyase [Bacteroidetes bacterium]|nr:putative lactoylglutathione lyase [Bacteroidota bacterium]